MNSKSALSVILVLLFSIYLYPAENRKCAIKILKSGNKTVTINAEIAETDYARREGLMFRRILPEDYGMLFVFSEEGHMNFWMKNTFVPLSIAFISKNGTINEIYRMKPLDISVTYPSRLPAKYALEVQQGWFSRNRVKPGHKLIFNGCFGK